MSDGFVPDDGFTPDSSGEGRIKPTFWEALLASMKERGSEIGQLPGDLATSAKNVGTALSDPNLPLRLSASTVPGLGPVAQSVVNLGTEGLAQYREGQFRPLSLALATLPAVLAGGARAVRAGDRMATRAIPSKFAGAQQEAQDAAANLVQGFRPDTRALYQQAQAAAQTAPPLDLTDTGRVLSEMRTQQTLAPSLSPASDAARELVDKVQPVLGQPTIPYPTMQAYMEELNKAIASRAPGAKAATALSGAGVSDYERAAAGGSQAADLARQSATAYKSKLGAARLEDAVTKASPPLTGSGPALNVRALSRAVQTDKELPRLLGQPGMEQVGGFLDRFRGLPPDRMSTLATIAKGALGSGPGAYIGHAVGGPAGAAIGGAIGALGPEYLQNLAYVGANPPGLNQGITLSAQAIRALLGLKPVQ